VPIITPDAIVAGAESARATLPPKARAHATMQKREAAYLTA
jgi:hypothetical protein